MDVTTPVDLDQAAHIGLPIVVYDGDCGFCRAQVDRLRRWDSAQRLAFVQRQFNGLDDRYPALTNADFSTGMRLIEPDGTIFIGADAVYRIAAHLPRWRWIAWLYCVPGVRWIARKAYAWIARNRYRLGRSCEDGACEFRAAGTGGESSDQEVEARSGKVSPNRSHNPGTLSKSMSSEYR